jgi:hypothetical protein
MKDEQVKQNRLRDIYFDVDFGFLFVWDLHVNTDTKKPPKMIFKSAFDDQ